MYAVLGSKGNIFIATDIKNIRGNKLVFRVDGEIYVTYDIMNLAECGEIYNPGNGQFIGTWERDEADLLHIRCVENNGNLRQFTNIIFPSASYLRPVKPKGMELVPVKWRKAGSNGLYRFEGLIERHKTQNKQVLYNNFNARFIAMEGVINNKVVCRAEFDVYTNRLVFIDLFGISADSAGVSEAFKYLGKCKYVSNNLNTLAMTDGASTQFWNCYKYTEFDVPCIYVVRTGRGKGLKDTHIFNRDEYVNFQNSYKGHFHVSELEVVVDGFGNIDINRKAVYEVKA